MFCVPRYAKSGGPNFFARSARVIVPPPSKPWHRPCQGETAKVKFVYNWLTSDVQITVLATGDFRLPDHVYGTVCRFIYGSVTDLNCLNGCWRPICLVLGTAALCVALVRSSVYKSSYLLTYWRERGVGQIKSRITSKQSTRRARRKNKRTTKITSHACIKCAKFFCHDFCLILHTLKMWFHVQ